jgi:hypothetical protein
MHVRDLLELATVVASHGPTLVAPGVPLPAAGLERYWTASKTRLDRWGHTLKRFASQGAAPRNRQVSWQIARRVVEEILASEVLTRTWTALLAAHDRRRRVQEVEPIGQSVFIGHLEARQRAIKLLLRDPAIPAEHAVALNRLRRRVERWSDLLVGRMLVLGDVSEFASDSQRCREFAADLRSQEDSQGDRLVWPLTLSAMRGAFAEGLDPLSANPDLNAAIANSLLTCFGVEQFDSSGLLQSTWMARLTNASVDTELLIEDYFALDTPPGKSPAPGTRLGPDRNQKPDRFRG